MKNAYRIVAGECSSVDRITHKGVELLPHSVAWRGSHEDTAAAVAAAMNSLVIRSYPKGVVVVFGPRPFWSRVWFRAVQHAKRLKRN